MGKEVSKHVQALILLTMADSIWGKAAKLWLVKIILTILIRLWSDLVMP
jgi:hypothetical protein